LAAGAVALTLSTTSAVARVIFQEDFESGVANGFTFEHPESTWHVTENFPSSGRYALGWVRDETPGPVPNGRYSLDIGTAWSPVIPLEAGARNVLTLELWGAFEYGWDTFRVSVSGTGGFYTIASTLPALMMPGGTWIVAGPTYQQVQVDLTALGLSGNLTLLFRTYVSDGDQNDFPGARIDNIRVEAFTVPEPSSLLGTLLALGIAGATLGKRLTRASVRSTPRRER